MNKNLIRLSKPSVSLKEKDAISRILDDGYLGMGKAVAEFEDDLRTYFGGQREVICVGSGTAALHMAVAALGIGPGDEVLVPTITYVACFQAVSAAGARPIPCDVRDEDIFIDLVDAKRRLTSATRAIMPVLYASSSRRLDDVYDFARANDLRVIEDAAHAFGCITNGIKVGSVGDIVCFSFDAIKNITCGEGGAIVTSDTKIARWVREARFLGINRDTGRTNDLIFNVHHQGFRYHMSNIMAAIGREQIKKFPHFAQRRRFLAARYREELGRLKQLAILDFDWEGLVPHIFVIKVFNETRNSLVNYLNDRGIETGFHYQPNHKLDMFAAEGGFPSADRLAEQLLTLPLHAELSDDDQSRIIGEIKAFYQIS